MAPKKGISCPSGSSKETPTGIRIKKGCLQ
jgi:hypothetical protein